MTPVTFFIIVIVLISLANPIPEKVPNGFGSSVTFTSLREIIAIIIIANIIYINSNGN